MTKQMMSAMMLAAMLAGDASAQKVKTTTSTSYGVGAAFAQGQGEGQSQPPVKDDLFAGADIFEKNATSVTDINMGPDSLGMVSSRHADQARRMLLNSVKTYEYDQPGMFNMADVDKFRKKLDTGDWHCSVHERNLKTGESTDICQKYRTDGYREDAIITVEKKELTFIHRIQKDGSDGHSDVMLEPLVSSFDVMPAMAMLNTAKMDAAMAKMQAFSAAHMAGLKGPMMMVLPRGTSGEPLPAIELKLDKLQVNPDIKINPDVQVKIKRFDEATPSSETIMTLDNSEAPAVAPVPEPPPVLAPPAVPAPQP